MAHRTTAILGMGALLLAVVGCNTITVFEERSGKVIDATTMMPIEGVYVQAEAWMIERPTMTPVRLARVFDTRTDAQGKWHVPGDTDAPKLVDRVESVQTFVEKYYFSARGYRTRKFEPKKGSGVKWLSPRIPSQVLMTPE